MKLFLRKVQAKKKYNFEKQKAKIIHLFVESILAKKGYNESNRTLNDTKSMASMHALIDKRAFLDRLAKATALNFLRITY